MVRAWGDAHPSRDEQWAAKRASLVREASQAFRQKGFHATTMDDIASSLAVSKGALYRYINSKHDVLYECYLGAEKLGDEALLIANHTTGNGRNKLTAFLNHFIKNYVTTSVAGGVTAGLDALLPKHRLEIVAGRDRIERSVRSLIQGGIDDGSLRAIDPKLSVFAIMGSINWIPSWFSSSGDLSGEQIAHGLVDFFVNGLKPAPALSTPLASGSLDSATVREADA